ncbi:MAG: SIS domain-containing protein, partial [Acidimicrobiales bacterium]
MCGVVAVLRRRSSRPLPDGAALVATLERAVELLVDGAAFVSDAAAEVASVDLALRGVPGVTLLAGDAEAAGSVQRCVTRLEVALASLDAALDDGHLDLRGQSLEAVNAAVVACKDAVWAVGHDRLGAARAVAELARSSDVAAYLSIQIALSSLDRLEVRGRDSAG